MIQYKRLVDLVSYKDLGGANENVLSKMVVWSYYFNLWIHYGICGNRE